MVEFGSLHFWLASAALILAVRLVGGSSARRRWLFGAATASLYLSEVTAGLLMLGTCAYGCLALHTLRSRRQLVLHCLVLTAILLYGLRQLPTTESLFAVGILPLVGLSYVYLRVLHVLIDVWNGRLERPGIAEFLTYLLPFHQLYAGPIERFSDYRRHASRPLAPLSDGLTLRALNRLTSGLVKQYVIVVLLKESLGFAFTRNGLPLWLEVDLHAVYVYLNFSGYMDIIIGIGMLAGWTPPENFNWPYLSRNLIKFWTRWHITLSYWIRDYIFIPLNLALQRRLGRNARMLAGAVSYLVAMVFCGWWHRPDLQFALWGAIQGLGIIACKLYESMLRRTLSAAAMKAYRSSTMAAVAAGFVTFQFVAISFVFAFNPIGDALDIVARMFALS